MQGRKRSVGTVGYQNAEWNDQRANKLKEQKVDLEQRYVGDTDPEKGG